MLARRLGYRKSARARVLGYDAHPCVDVHRTAPGF